jgi:hypothetical protein
MATDPSILPVGDIDLFDHEVPNLFGGNYWVTATHTLAEGAAEINTDPLQAVQEFVVSAPQLRLDPSEIVSRHPPDASSGRFGEQLAHVVFREPALPWERRINGPAGTTQPWLALLVLTDDELMGATDSPARSTSISIADFLSKDLGAFKPTITPEDDVDTAQACVYIQLPAGVFTAVTPRLAELRFLAHCRQANVSDKAAQGLDPNGFFSAVVANRFPARPSSQTPATRNIVHLVSMEGLEPVLTDTPDFGGRTSVALLSLANWTFQCLPDNAADFRGLVDNLVASERAAGASYRPDALWLRLPPATLPVATDSATAGEITSRLAEGFVPLDFHARTGEEAFAWYRGPLTPVLPAPLVKSGPLLSADAAIAYQKTFGTFDMSLGAAWQAGRAIALADRVFGQKLLDWRRRTHQLTDRLLARLQGTFFFTQDQIDSLSTDTTVHDEFLGVLDAALLQQMAAAADGSGAVPQPASTQVPAVDPQTAVKTFLADPAVQQKLISLVADDMADIAQWLARLLLLYPVPFNLLVPDAHMLQPETLRFFYLDNNWTGAVLDGALSLGLESSRQTFFHSVTHGILHDAAFAAAQRLRASLIGVDPPVAESKQSLVSGFLLRSSLVSGWPTMAVRPYLADGTMLRILRMDHLSPTVLLCLFWGVPDRIEISEPQEGFRFGVDDDGNVTLRNLVAPEHPDGVPLGTQIGAPLRVYDPTGAAQLGMRAVSSRTLNLAPGSPSGLVQQVFDALTKAMGSAPVSFGPAAFALQMVKAPEAIAFTSQTPRSAGERDA